MIEHTLLEYDEETGYALAMTSLTAPQPFVVCYKYDTASGEWSQGHYHSTLEDAVVDYNEEVGGPFVTVAGPDLFCARSWGKDFVREVIEYELGPEWATESNVELAMAQLFEPFGDRLSEEVFELMADLLDESALVPPLSQ